MMSRQPATLYNPSDIYIFVVLDTCVIGVEGIHQRVSVSCWTSTNQTLKWLVRQSTDCRCLHINVALLIDQCPIKMQNNVSMASIDYRVKNPRPGSQCAFGRVRCRCVSSSTVLPVFMPWHFAGAVQFQNQLLFFLWHLSHEHLLFKSPCVRCLHLIQDDFPMNPLRASVLLLRVTLQKSTLPSIRAFVYFLFFFFLCVHSLHLLRISFLTLVLFLSLPLFLSLFLNYWTKRVVST